MNHRILRIVGTVMLALVLNITTNPNLQIANGGAFDAIPTSNVAVSSIQGAEDLVGPAVNIFLGIALSVSLIGIMFAGVKIIWSKGDPKAVETGRAYLNYSIRALLFSFAAIALEQIIRNTFGADIDMIGLE
ncbi:hypothetical protein HN803_05845 [candidate division WWE3 bacterium]|jgi:hypothetical protein|nr:hypothetical protein [candidate division WWE3 bacterium]MBT7350277.1 hypothetical protein [candidate division WWE3 bacterium]